MDLVCFSHLNWNFVYQRPQHLLTRFTKYFRVFYIQEFEFNDRQDGCDIEVSIEGVFIISPHLAHHGAASPESRKLQILDNLFAAHKIDHWIAWYYTPMALLFSDHLNPALTIYDCMDELAAFKFADPQLKVTEDRLFEKADLVFTGGNALYAAKQHKHHNIHSFPSSIDKAHFEIARYKLEEFDDQAGIPHPRLGFFGVIDERFDIDLIAQAAELRPDWHFVLVGPIVKIDPAILPKHGNIHYLGSKKYQDLPVYLSGWDIALIPFAINESTRFISPTKTPEYLAAGKPVISTPITDVIDPYEKLGLVHIVNDGAALVAAAATELRGSDNVGWLAMVDEHLSTISWDNTWDRMNQLIKKALTGKQHFTTQKTEAYV